MTDPILPWYPAIERSLRPIDSYTRLVLLGLALATLAIAWRGDSVTRMAWLIYLVSP